VKCKLDSGKDHTSSRLRERRRAAPSPFSNQVTPVDMVSRAETYDKLPPAHLPSSDARDFKRPSLSLAIACLWVKTGRRPGDPNHTRPLSIACSRRYHRGSVNPKSVRGNPQKRMHSRHALGSSRHYPSSDCPEDSVSSHARFHSKLQSYTSPTTTSMPPGTSANSISSASNTSPST
jgi:hypothetical protein